jgi:hypothetical protein
VRNATLNEADRVRPMIAVAQYRKAATGANLIDDPNAEISSELFFAVSQPLTAVALTEAFRNSPFDFGRAPFQPTRRTSSSPWVRPAPALEDDAVMVGQGSASSPTR